MNMPSPVFEGRSHRWSAVKRPARTSSFTSAWRRWRDHRVLPTTVVVLVLCAWALWVLLVFSHPLAHTNIGAVVEPARQGQVQRWTVATRADVGARVGLANPVDFRWNTSSAPLTSDETGSEPVFLAWADDQGNHVARLDSTDVTVRTAPGEGTVVSYGEGQGVGHVTVTLPEARHVDEMSALIGTPRLLRTGIMPALALALGVALLWREPRHRTRWGWFWLLLLPLGAGFVWILLREQCFLSSPAPARKARPGGWTGLVLTLVLAWPLGLLLTGVAPTG